MQQIEKISDISLFNGFSKDELQELLRLIKAEIKINDAESIIMHEGDRNHCVFIILSGQAIAVKYDLLGKVVIYTKLTHGCIFGDILAVSAEKESPVTVKVTEKTEILKFRFDDLVEANGNCAELRVRMLKNLTAELAQKFFDLQDRVNCLISSTLREKILTFLNNEVKNQKGINFNITMNRERLAAYLNTDRSALSRELSKLKKEGIIDFYKNSFKIIKKEERQ
ncbi:MAG: hypothetical protein A2Y40_06340 [Candidatus Margulisbacteria bacterium GWF2_35_9]|nr:MAG: hypothetical protein A2Y40_06340 [Candidatus Margulisbacteria bacterium GWF2_35_9]